MKMTKRQEQAVAKIRALVEKDMLIDDNHEIKKFDLKELEYFVSVIVETGMKNDEGTLASILCRDRAHMFVWKGGRVTYPVSKTLKNGKFKCYDKPFKANLWSVVCDQRI